MLLVQPRAFGFNAETAGSNTLQRAPAGRAQAVQDAALGDFNRLRQALRGEGVQVIVAEDDLTPVKPDAVFPNNWVSFHADGTVVLYPMLAASRRAERRREIIDQVIEASGGVLRRLLDLTAHEQAGRFLEGTGSLVLDHVGRVAYACRSPRTDARSGRTNGARTGLSRSVVRRLGCRGRAVLPHECDAEHRLGFRGARSRVGRAGQRDRVRAELQDSGRRVIEISPRRSHASPAMCWNSRPGTKHSAMPACW